MDGKSIDGVRLAKELMAGCEQAGLVSVAIGSSYATDLGDQLERDAGSLELTGASFAKDEAFYQNVAANLRKAANHLKSQKPLLDALYEHYARRRADAVDSIRLFCATAACDVRELMPEALGGDRADGWRAAADAIRQIILAGPSEPAPSERRATPEAGQ